MNLVWVNLMQMSLMAGVLIMGILLFRSLMVHRIPKRIMIILWEIVVLRLLLPVAFPLDVSLSVPGIHHLLDSVAEPERFGGTFLTVVTAEPEQEESGAGTVIFAVEKESSVDWRMVFRVLYLTGAAAMIGGSVYLYLRDGHLFKESLPMPEEERERILRQMAAGEEERQFFERIRFRVSDRTATPVVYGMLRPSVVFPKAFCQGERSVYGRETAFCLWHELAHIRNHDNVRKLVLCGVLCIHWFNPLVWVMYFLFNRDMELLSDEAAIRHCRADKKEYAMALLSMAQYGAAGFGTAPGFGKNAVKERILAVMRAKETRGGVALAAAAVVIAVLIVFLPAQSTVAGASQKSAVYEARGEETSTYIVNETGEHAYYTITADTVNNAEYGQETTYAAVSESASDRNESDHAGTEATASYEVNVAYADTVAAAESTENALTQSAEDALVQSAENASAEETETAWEMAEGETSAPFLSAAWELGEEFETYGLSVEISDNNYQLYFEGEPVYFFADNQSGDEDFFSGRVFAKPASRKNGYTGVITVRNTEGEITGLLRLSEEESEGVCGSLDGREEKSQVMCGGFQRLAAVTEKKEIFNVAALALNEKRSISRFVKYLTN